MNNICLLLIPIAAIVIIIAGFILTPSEPEVIYIEVPAVEAVSERDYTAEYFKCFEKSGDAVGYCQQKVARDSLNP